MKMTDIPAHSYQSSIFQGHVSLKTVIQVVYQKKHLHLMPITHIEFHSNKSKTVKEVQPKDFVTQSNNQQTNPPYDF